MDLNGKKTSSRDLLSCGNGGGLSKKLLLKPRGSTSLQTERVPRSSVLDRLQSFLPQMAEANEKLRQQQLDGALAGHFDIEHVEGAERVIEMDVSLFELDESDSTSGDEDGDTSDPESEADWSELTEQNLKLPGDGGRKRSANIQLLEQP